MRIDAIQKRRGRKSVLISDGAEVAVLDNELILLSGLREGMQIEEDALEELIVESDQKRARQKALWLLSKRDYAKKELILKLKQDATEESAELAVQRMEELGLIDDQAYAVRRAKDLFAFKAYSAEKIMYELVRRGIDSQTAKQTVQELAPDPSERLKELIERKYKRYLEDEKGRQKVWQTLSRMGYSYSDINTALKRDEYD